ncbi:MAG: flagellar biosynthetic protein FliR, partial [Phycisphaerales bacterium]|nr:flagellar biosynthetic protein FliR [Phycisphaerales bacterium]
LTGVAIPARVKVLLCFVMAAALFGLVRPTIPVSLPGDAFSFAALAVSEVAVGVVIGLLALLPVVAVQLGGVIMGQQMGLSLATVYDPSTENESEVTSELLLQGAMIIFILFGGLETLFLSVARSFAGVPVGGAVWSEQAPAAMRLVAGLLGTGFELALRVSTPVLGIIFVETLATGMVMKTMPQMNIMSIGFGLKVLLGLGALVLALHAIDDAVGEHLTAAGHALLDWPAAPQRGGGG